MEVQPPAGPHALGRNAATGRGVFALTGRAKKVGK